MLPVEYFLLFIATPAVLLLALIEALVLSRRERYDWRAFGISAANMFMRIAANILLPLTIATPLMHWAALHQQTVISIDGWIGVVMLFFGLEFCFYWYHRAAHRVRFFWAHHSVHHTPNDLNLGAAMRSGIFGKHTGIMLFFVPMVWLGFSPRTVFAAYSLNLLFQFWLHTTWVPKLGWLEGIFNTPSAHRVHHATNPEYLDANFGGVLIIFDRLFGTYVAEREDVPCRYGLVQPITDHNYFKIEFGQWAALLRDLIGARSVRAWLGYLFMPPGWVPHGEGDTTEALRLRHAKGGTSPGSVSG